MGRIHVTPLVAAAGLPPVARSERTTATSTKQRLVLSRWARVCVWLLVVVIMVFNASLLILFAVLYQQHETPKSLMWTFRVIYLPYESDQFVTRTAARVSLGYYALATVFMLSASVLVVSSASSWSRSRCFRCFSQSPTGSFCIVSSPPWATALRRCVSRIQYLVGVTGPYFDHRRLAEDLLEMANQTAAAYASSKSTSDRAVNLVYGGVLFLKGLTPSLASLLYPHPNSCSSSSSTGLLLLLRQRLVRVLVDLVLDFVWGSLLPIAMYIPLVQTWLLDVAITSDVSMFANSTREIERVVILSWKGYFLSVIPFLTSIANIWEVKSLLNELPAAATAATTTTISVAPAMQKKAAFPVRQGRQGWVFHLFHRLVLPLYGTAALVTTLVANRVFHGASPPSKFECIHPVYPWFTMEQACSGRRINCSLAGLTGSAEQVEPVLNSFYMNSLDDLFFVNCPSIVIPPAIQRLSNLQSLVVKDSSIIQWDDQAALSATFFTSLRTVHLDSVQFTEIPQGLVSALLPPTVEWIHLTNISNASQILQAVGTKWAQLRTFDCNNCALTEFPPVIKTMKKLAHLLLVGNDLATIPDDWLAASDTPQLDVIWLNGNPRLTALPESMWRQASTCEIIALIATSVTTMPPWVPEIASPKFVILAAFSPLCLPSETTKEQQELPALVLCGPPQ